MGANEDHLNYEYGRVIDKITDVRDNLLESDNKTIPTKSVIKILNEILGDS